MSERGLVLPDPVAVHGGWFDMRPWQHGDEPALQAIADDPLIVQWSPLHRESGGVEAWIARRMIWDTQISWAVVGRRGELLGCSSLWLFDADNASASLGYWVAPAHRGTGVASEAARLATRFAFEITPIVRLTLCHAVENTASCRVAERAGFPLEGTTRLSWRYPDGRLHDEHLHALLRVDLPS